jgi:hypothetical protein
MSSLSAADDFPAQALELESEWPPFSNLRVLLSNNSSVNSQPQAPKVRDANLRSGDQFSAAEKDEGCIVHILEMYQRECADDHLGR